MSGYQWCGQESKYLGILNTRTLISKTEYFSETLIFIP